MKNQLSHNVLTASVVALLSLGAFLTPPPAQAAESSAPSEPDPMQFVRGAKAWANNCNRCHRIRDPKELRDDQWRAVLSHMRVRGGLTGQETRDILAFLQGSN